MDWGHSLNVPKGRGNMQVKCYNQKAQFYYSSSWKVAWSLTVIIPSLTGKVPIVQKVAGKVLT